MKTKRKTQHVEDLDLFDSESYGRDVPILSGDATVMVTILTTSEDNTKMVSESDVLSYLEEGDVNIKVCFVL